MNELVKRHIDIEAKAALTVLIAAAELSENFVAPTDAERASVVLGVLEGIGITHEAIEAYKARISAALSPPPRPPLAIVN